MSRYIDADKLHPDKLTVGGSLAISQSQIAEQPTADVRENVRGEWQQEGNDYNVNAWKCSICGWSVILHSGTPSDQHCNFCTNCGADMRGEEHE